MRTLARFVLVLALAASLVFVTGCCTPSSGSREFIPGQGWVPND